MNRTLRLFVCGLLASVCALAQTPSGQQSGQNKQSSTPSQTQLAKATLSGKAIDASSGKPLKKVWIVVRKQGDGRQVPLGTVTDAQGVFTIRDVDPTRYFITASKTGYVTQQYGQASGPRGGRGTPLDVAPGAEIKDITFKMQPGGVIAGRVVDEDGEPVSGVQIMSMRYVYMDGERRLAPSGNARTDDRGEYRIFGITGGKYYLNASMRNSFQGEMMAGIGPAEEGYATMYYPGVTDFNGAQAIEIKAGDEQHADFTFVPTKTYKVRGRLIDGQTGEPAKNANVGLNRRGQAFGFGMMGGTMATIRTDGQFEIRGVSPGSYYLTAFVFNQENPQMARMEVEVGDSDVDGLSLTTQAGRTFSGSIRVEGKSDFKVSDLTVWLQPPQGQGMFFGPGQGPTKIDGTFQLKNIGDDDYTLRVMGLQSDMYVKSARVGSEDVLENGFNINRVKGSSLDIVVSANGGTLDGTVNKDDNTYQGAQVVLIPERTGRAKPERAKTATTDQNGKFTMKGIKPGHYKLYAFEDIENGSWEDPDVIRKYEGDGKSIDFSEGAHKMETLKLIPSDGGQGQ